MPYVSSVVHKLVPAVTIVMPSSDGTRNPSQYEFFQESKICSSILERSDIREYVRGRVVKCVGHLDHV